MTTSLFLEPEVPLQKAAAEVAMPEDPNVWPDEILKELFQQVPYLADFEPHIVMDKVDAERGYALGHVEVTNQTEIQRGADPEGMAAAGLRSARIPLVVKDRKLQPIDLLITTDSKILPLTERRLRQAIFRPQMFDITSRTPGDQSIIGQLYPPYRQNYGFGGGGVSMSVGMGKTGQVDKRVFLLPDVLSAAHPQDVQRIQDHLQKSAGLRALYIKNAASTSGALEALSQYSPSNSPEKLAAALESAHVPSVVQVRRANGGYTVKSASHYFWAPETKRASREEVIRQFGAKVAMDADLNGSVTMSLGADQETNDQPEADKAELITQFGIYKVQDEKGRHLIGYVFPNLLDIDGRSLPICLFTNGSHRAVQGEIAGINVGGGASLFEGHPRGFGAFYQLLSNGRAQATVPLTIRASLDDGTGVKFVAQKFDGQQVQVSIEPNIKGITLVDGVMLVPDTFSWLPLEGAEDAELATTPEVFQEMSSMKVAAAKVQIRAQGHDVFSIDGLPVDKLASSERHFLNVDDALFLLTGLGIDTQHAAVKMAEAIRFERPVDVLIGRQLVTGEERVKEAQRVAQEALGRIPDLRQDLVKEAAFLPDPTAVDTVLSLGLLNPENLGIFIAHLPEIDATQERLCELLLASRLGMKDVPTSALERSVKGIEEVLEGLRTLAFQT